MNRILVIGHSDAGISAALCAKEVDPQAAVTVVVANQYQNFSICGLPFYPSGEVQDRKTLAHRTAADKESFFAVVWPALWDLNGNFITYRFRKY